MTQFSIRIALILCTLLGALTLGGFAHAETDASEAGGMLVTFLEDSLSADNRTIRVEGLEGTLSAKATIRRLSVADDEGIWLTLEGVVLDWNRLALLRGNFSINTLRADKIDLIRAPGPSANSDELPSPEATPFSLPDLPVSIEIAEIAVGELTLGEAFIQEGARLTLDGNLSLVDAQLDADLSVSRLDRQSDQLAFKLGYADATQRLDLILTLKEQAGGLLSQMLAIPDSPSLEFRIEGGGLLSNLDVGLVLESNGQQRLGGTVALRGLSDIASGTSTGLSFNARLEGDIDPLLRPEHRAFFGPSLLATIKGKSETGTLHIDSLALRTQAMALRGAMELGGEQGLQHANMSLALSPPGGASDLLLPIPGEDIRIGAAALSFRNSKPAGWTVTGTLESVVHRDMNLGELRLNAEGTLDSTSALQGSVEAGVSDLRLTDPKLSTAVGQELELTANISTLGPADLTITDLTFKGADYGGHADVDLTREGSDLAVDADVSVQTTDLSRFSALSGQNLGGSADAEAVLRFLPVSGAFDLELKATTNALDVGIPDLTTLIDGDVQLWVNASRGVTGLELETLRIVSEELKANASGRLSSSDAQISLAASLSATELLLPKFSGATHLQAELQKEGNLVSANARITAPNEVAFDLVGSGETDGAIGGEYSFEIGKPGALMPELRSQSLRAKGTAQRDQTGRWQTKSQLTAAAGTSLEVNGGYIEESGVATINYQAIVRELGQIIPSMTGVLNAKGTAERAEGVWTIETSASGPLGVDATVSGTLDEKTLTADLGARGTLRLEGMNPFLAPNLLTGPAQFQLSMRGPAEVESIYGQISVENAQLIFPDARQVIEDIRLNVQMSNGRAQISGSAAPRDGGSVTVSGPVTLLPPYATDLNVRLDNVVLTDELTYESSLSGALHFNGPLTGTPALSGQINVGETNININAAGGSVSAAPIPPIRHIGQTAAQTATRRRAGLTQSTASSGSGSDMLLDLTINAPNRIFVRGRGLNAELGGAINIAGSASDVIPSGQIELIRGKFDVLGRRLSLDEGRIVLEGSLIPRLAFRSSTDTSEGSATLEVSGPLTAPEILVTSEPPRPSEEALALLLFGDNISDISPLALAKLASSILTLSGKSGQAQEKLRASTGASDVDFGTDNLGVGQLGLGGYLAQNVYTDLNITAQGQTELSINLDLSPSISVIGSADSDGQTGIGFAFKRDY